MVGYIVDIRRGTVASSHFRAWVTVREEGEERDRRRVISRGSYPSFFSVTVKVAGEKEGTTWRYYLRR